MLLFFYHNNVNLETFINGLAKLNSSMSHCHIHNSLYIYMFTYIYAQNYVFIKAKWIKSQNPYKILVITFYWINNIVLCLIYNLAASNIYNIDSFTFWKSKLQKFLKYYCAKISSLYTWIHSYIHLSLTFDENFYLLVNSYWT